MPLDMELPQPPEPLEAASAAESPVSSLICSCLRVTNGIYTESNDEKGQHYSTPLRSPKISDDGTCHMHTHDDADTHLSSSILHGNFNNNCNSGKIHTSKSSQFDDPPRKRFKIATGCPKGNIEVTLEGKTLWDEFCHRGTEMIVNRAGRRMFPGFSVAIGSLKPKAKYSMKLEVVLADNHRFKFLNSRWLAVGSAEPQPLCESYLHPDSPNSGAFWMRHGVSFRKLKITNNKERPGNNALLYSMHKYFLRLIVEEERKGEGKSSAKIALQADFRETTFVAVTAYQNEEVTQLKITNNPFAKAFRENTADMDWETAQMLYSNQSNFGPPTHQQSDHFGNGCWTFPGPLVSHSPLLSTTSLPPLSPLPGFVTPNSVYLPPTLQFPYTPSTPTVSSPNYFQWPVTHHPSNRPNLYNQYSVYHKVDNSGYSSPSTGDNLPDFETVFTTMSN